ncbi:MAG: hypothetical protein SFU25_11960 [Candidatus Caenarcaniphilales bacterium]|nr:hypothetical protein [Candidatus Caenarcaniphilales bacterium]
MPPVADFVFFVFLLSNLVLGLCSLVDLPIHYFRGLGHWERISHPVDAFAVFLTMLTGYYAAKSQSSILFWAYCFFSLATVVLSYKDEFIHKIEAPGYEQLLHAVMFSSSAVLLVSGAVLVLLKSNSFFFLIAALGSLFFMFLHIGLNFFVKFPLAPSPSLSPERERSKALSNSLSRRGKG